MENEGRKKRKYLMYLKNLKTPHQKIKLCVLYYIKLKSNILVEKPIRKSNVRVLLRLY